MTGRSRVIDVGGRHLAAHREPIARASRHMQFSADAAFPAAQLKQLAKVAAKMPTARGNWHPITSSGIKLAGPNMIMVAEEWR